MIETISDEARAIQLAAADRQFRGISLQRPKQEGNRLFPKTLSVTLEHHWKINVAEAIPESCGKRGCKVCGG